MAPKSLFRIKLVVAFTLVTAILAFGARQFLPRMPLHELVLISIACWVIAMTVIGALVLGKIAFADFILRRGGTDVQWLSLGREPPGLERLRSKDQ